MGTVSNNKILMDALKRNTVNQKHWGKNKKMFSVYSLFFTWPKKISALLKTRLKKLLKMKHKEKT